ncbi:MAG: hypothetical protein ACXVQZ_04680, partial [Gaiellaceae bacterium]
AVRFAARPGARCQVRLQLAGSVAVGLTDHGTVSLGGRVDVGTARVNVACRSLPLAFSLEIEHPAPPG